MKSAYPLFTIIVAGGEILDSSLQNIARIVDYIDNHLDKDKITHSSDQNCIIGLNDYTKNFSCEDEQPGFDFYAAVEVTDFTVVPDGMITKELPATKYVVFSFSGKPQDLQPVADYIYKEWFPQSTCQFNENNMYDFSKSYETADNDGNSNIEYWVPIL